MRALVAAAGLGIAAVVTAQPAGYVDVEVGLQTRFFAETGIDGQDQLQPAAHGRITWRRDWDDGEQRLTVTPFVRLDALDDERTHVDLRELFWSRLGLDWEFHLGFRQVFWGVTEFKHLVDVINQTDLVENIDGEDKLGQPMAHLSLVRGGGILDIFLLTGFRERTYPGADGRLRWSVLIDDAEARYESDAEQYRLDGAIRWSQDWGPLSYGLYHFSGTSRDPLYQLTIDEPTQGPGPTPMQVVDPSQRAFIAPLYPVIDQTGLDAQLVAGDWAFKLETIRRSGFGDRYAAFNAGFERTLVGIFGTRADLGLVAEYLYDERGDDAFDTLFERDVALGARWSLNDAADSHALFGFIVDRETHEHVLSIEASRRFGDAWLLSVEGRAFGGADPVAPDDPLMLRALPQERSAPFQRDDYLQLELIRYF